MFIVINVPGFWFWAGIFTKNRNEKPKLKINSKTLNNKLKHGCCQIAV